MKTIVVAIRHAKPVDPLSCSSDADRALTDEGKSTQRRMANLLKQKGLLPELILSSPLLRAVQTSEILAEVLGGSVIELPALGTSFHADQLIKEIPAGQTTFMVGHEPTLAQFVNQLLGRNAFPSGLEKSSAAVVLFDGPVEYGNGVLLAYHRA